MAKINRREIRFTIGYIVLEVDFAFGLPAREIFFEVVRIFCCSVSDAY